MHVVGDIHQPLHATSQFSAAFPKGDQGGNRLVLRANSIAKNLHSYWDRGGGFLKTSKHYPKNLLAKKAYSIEKHWPCELQKMNLNPEVWAAESQRLARTQAYQIKSGQKPSKKYQQSVKLITEQRLALAGCRLAALLNNLA